MTGIDIVWVITANGAVVEWEFASLVGRFRSVKVVEVVDHRFRGAEDGPLRSRRDRGGAGAGTNRDGMVPGKRSESGTTAHRDGTGRIGVGSGNHWGSRVDGHRDSGLQI